MPVDHFSPWDRRAANLYSDASGDPIQNSDPLGMETAGTSLCVGICVGMTLGYVPGKGISACVEFGFGVGNSVEYNPLGDLDPNKLYDKASAEAKLGPFAGVEGTIEANTDGCYNNYKGDLNGCVLGVCVNANDPDLQLKGLDIAESIAKAAEGGGIKAGVEAKAVAGVCQQALW